MAWDVACDLLLSRLGRLSAQIGENERKLSSGTPEQKVRAAGDLAELRQRAEAIHNRLQQLRSAESSAFETLKTEIEVEWQTLSEAFERWLDRTK